MINYWAIPNMGKMHLMQLIELNEKTYVKTGGKYYFYKQWHDPNNFAKRIEKSYVVRKGFTVVETPIKTKTTAGQKSDVCFSERHEYLDLVEDLTIDSTKLHSNTSEVGGDLMVKYFGNVSERKPPDEFMKGKDPVEVFFTDKHFAELQKHFPVSPSGNYLGTFLEPYIHSNSEFIMPLVEDLINVDIMFNPFSLLGKYMLGYIKEIQLERTELEKYVLNFYKSRKNIIPYKENLVDCFASKLKRIKKYNVIEKYNRNKRMVWASLDGVVRNLRRIEKYLQDADIDAAYFNMDRDDYGEVFGFEKNELPRDHTHPGDYPEREQYEQIAKEYVTIRDMRDMRRRNRLRDWI
tara:strand:- start:895 stop:1944 length:1050 start_codon:yes stop_codon:yes gene_type:complete